MGTTQQGVIASTWLVVLLLLVVCCTMRGHALQLKGISKGRRLESTTFPGHTGGHVATTSHDSLDSQDQNHNDDKVYNIGGVLSSNESEKHFGNTISVRIFVCINYMVKGCFCVVTLNPFQCPGYPFFLLALQFTFINCYCRT